MDVLGRHRIAFNNIGVQLFGELERDLESVLKKGAEEKAELERLVNDQKKFLEERDTRVQQAAKIREQKKKIDELNLNLAKALVENERLEELLNPKKFDEETQRTVLGMPPDKSLQNKENITPIFNYLAPSPSRIPALNKPISPPKKSPIKPSIRANLSKDHGIQTEPSTHKDGEAQTDSILLPDDLTEAYHDLAARYDILRDELNTYKGAHEELQEKYLKNKKAWEAWTKADSERREKSRKRRREGSIIPEVGGRIVHGCATPATSIAGRSPCSRPLPPTLSPNKPMLKSAVSKTIPKKPGLFANFKGSTEKGKASDDLGIDIGTSASIKNAEIQSVTAPNRRIRSESEGGNGDSWPSSVPETQSFQAAIVSPIKVSDDLKSSHDLDVIEGTGTTDSESNKSRSSITTPTDRPSNFSRPDREGSPTLPYTDAVFKVPKVKREGLGAKRTRSGDSVSRPVVIKSEPSSISSEGFGYHLFEQESLDLDDIGYKPETSRKRQKTHDLMDETASGGSSGRIGWINGGFTIKRTPGVEETQYPDGVAIEVTQDEDEGLMFNDEEFSVPVFPSLAMNYEEFGGIRTDSQLARPKTPPGVASAIPITIPKQKPTTPATKSKVNKVIGSGRNPLSSSEKKIRSPPQGNRVSNQTPVSTPVRSLPTVVDSIHHKQFPQKLRVGHRATSADAIEIIAEDGSGRTEDVGSDEFSLHPPMMLTEKQRKKLEETARLIEILNSPAPRTPSLAHLKKKMDVAKSVPAKKPLERTFESCSSSEPPKRSWIDPMRHTKGSRDPSKLDISHFRVNPDVNEGRDYAFAETVRNREARKCLPGCIKACCKGLAGFVEAAGLPPPVSRGPRWRSSPPPASVDNDRERRGGEALDKTFTAKFGKHRDAFVRRRSPPGFWNADFPDTQDIEKQNEAAEEMRIQKVEEMRKEAEKGGKGRYVYRG